MKCVQTLVAIMQGKAVVLVKRGERKGKNVNKQFAINSMVGAVKAMLL